MAAEDNFIVATVLGSSKITAVAGRKQPDGAIQVLACVQEPSDSFIRKGRINNVTKMKQCIINMKDKLEKKLQKSISHTYVGIGGMGMHTVSNTVVRHFDQKTTVTQELVDSMMEENKDTATPDRYIFEVVPQDYKIGTQSQTDPVGIPAETIEGHYLNIVANCCIREDVDNCFRNANLMIADRPITPLTLSDLVLSESEKRSGCVFVDMGSETTSVAIYKNNLLRHFAVIPLGGSNVNRDIASLQIEDSEAEELKMRFGAALYEDATETRQPVELKDGRSVKFEEFAGLVEARMEEIILNVAHQIELSKYDKSQLIGGIIITGGAANMKNMDKAFEKHTRFEKIRFATKSGVRIPLRTSLSDFNKDGSCNAALAIIDKAEFNCCGGELGNNTPALFPAEPAAEPVPAAPAPAEADKKAPKQEEEEEKPAKPKGPGIFSKFMTRMKTLANDLVSENDQDN